MEATNPLQSLLIFFLSAGMSGVLGGLRTVIGFYARQNPDHARNGEAAKLQDKVEKANALWNKPGFFESLSLGRFVLDGTAVLAGAALMLSMFPESGLVARGVISLLFCFVISHWMLPLLSQVFTASLGGVAFSTYRVYSFFFMGKLGELLFQTHDIAMRRMGFDPKLSFLGDANLGKLTPAADDEMSDRSGLQEDEKEMIRSIFDLRETQVKEIMTPRVDVVALEVSTPYEQVMELIADEKYSRIPVYKDTIDNILGILHIMDLMALRDDPDRSGFRLQDRIREAYFVPRTKKIGELMREFRQKHIHMAIVVDEYGGSAGIITLEDILEEIVGEIHDEDETETLKLRKLEDGVFLVDPIISLFDLNEELGISLKPEDPDIQIDTLGGFILFIHGKVPEKGDIIRFKEFTFEILEMDAQKMEKIKLTLPSLVDEKA